MSSMSAQHRLVPARFLKGTRKDRRVTQKERKRKKVSPLLSTLLLDRFGPSCSKHSSARARIKVMWREQQLEGAVKKKRDREERERARDQQVNRFSSR